jgi:hypothetical protein
LKSCCGARAVANTAFQSSFIENDFAIKTV